MNGPGQPANFAALVARLVLQAEAQGMLARAPSGELVPTGHSSGKVVQLFADSPVYLVVEEATDAAP